MNKYLKRSFLLIITLFIVTLVSNGISLKSIVHVYAAEKPVSGNFEYEILEDGTISIIRYTGNAAKVEFPSTLKNKKVTRIAPYDYSVFTDKNRNNVVSVIIPEGVTTIWDFAFSGCEKLKSVTLPDSLLGIDDWSFSNCRKLTGIKLPDHLQYIGQSAFANCTSLKKIIIPDSVDRIGDSYFNTTDSGNVDFYGDYGHTWINEGNIAAAFDGCDNLTSIRLPKNISAFALAHCKNLESITIPKGIEIVALRDCPKLKKINLSDSITDLYINECNSLLSLQVPNGLEQLNIRDCIGLKKVNIPESIANISLTGCAKIKSIRLTDSVTVIKDEAFMGCKSLQDINIPVSVSKVGKDILRDTAWYNKQKSGLIYKDKWCIGYKGDRTRIKSLTIAKGTKGIADKLTSTEETFNKIGYNSYEQILNSFDSLEKVALSDSVEFIGEDAFLRCDKLKSITLSKNLKEIGDEAFYGCSKLTTIKIPGNLVGIGDYAFADCTELENFNLPESIEHIGGAAFHSTGWLKKQKNGIVYKDNWIICYKGTMPGKCSLDIRKGTTGIADGAFSAQLNSSNKNLKSITIPDTIRYIGIMAFSKSGLEKVILPDNIEGLEGTFLSCSSLKEVQLPRKLIYLGE